MPAGFLSGSLNNLISHRSAQLREKIGLNETVAEGFEHRGLSGYYRLMKRYFALSPELREVRPAATSLDTYRDIIYLEPVICWDVSPPRAVQSQHRAGSRDPGDQSRHGGCLHLFGQFSASPGLLPRLPCNYGGFRVFSGQCRGHPPHPPTHNSEPRQNIEMFLDSLYILPVSQALYFVKRSQELRFIQ